MNFRGTLFCTIYIFLAGCQTEQFIPVQPPVSQVRVTTAATQPKATPVDSDPTASLHVKQATAQPQALQSTSTPIILAPDDCTEVAFISDVSIPDGTVLMAEEIFLKIWRLKNSGDCAWPEDLRLEFIAGDPMGAVSGIQAHTYPEGIPLIASLGEREWAESRQVVVMPEEVMDVPVFFQAPGIAGDYFSLWALRSSRSNDDLIQIYLDIQVRSPETPVPSTWGGVWEHINLHADESALRLAIEQREVQLQGFFYTSEGELFLLEGGLFDQGTRVEGTFGPPYDDGYPFTWQLTTDGRKFRGIYRDRIVSAGAWCGARPGEDLPNPCALVP